MEMRYFQKCSRLVGSVSDIRGFSSCTVASLYSKFFQLNTLALYFRKVILIHLFSLGLCMNLWAFGPKFMLFN